MRGAIEVPRIRRPAVAGHFYPREPQALRTAIADCLAQANRRQPAPNAARSVIWLSRLRAARGYDPAVRVLGSAWFLLLALAVAMKVLADAEAMSIADFSPTGWPALLSSVCLFLFYLALYWITG